MQTLFHEYCIPAHFLALCLPVVILFHCKHCGLVLLCVFFLPASAPHFEGAFHKFYFLMIPFKV